MKDSLPYLTGASVVVKKLSACENPLVKPALWANWKPGRPNSSSLPVAYELRGRLVRPVEIGEPIVVLRTHRNGVRADGIFTSTAVCSVEEGSLAITCNSVYQILPARRDDATGA